MKKSIKIILNLSFTVLLTNNLFSQIKIDNNNRVVVGGLITDASHKLTVKMDATTFSGILIEGTNANNWQPCMTTSVSAVYAVSYKMRLNGVDNFYVRGDGAASGTGFYTSSDMRLKKNIKNIDNAISKITKLQGVYYNFKEEVNYKTEAEKNRIGFLAQDLEKVIPEVVREDEKGIKMVAYQDLVALLTEGIKEQQIQIKELQTKLNELKATNLNVNETKSLATLNQNIPNPFNTETKIKYNIPLTCITANIYIYDNNGNKKKTIVITEKGENLVSIAANELGQGIYFYSLVVDGIICDSKTMLITE